jgi:hypothetical protein
MPSGMYCFSPIIATLAGSDIVAIVTPALAAVGAGAGALWHRANKVRDAQSAELGCGRAGQRDVDDPAVACVAVFAPRLPISRPRRNGSATRAHTRHLGRRV